MAVTRGTTSVGEGGETLESHHTHPLLTETETKLVASCGWWGVGNVGKRERDYLTYRVSFLV